MSTPYDHFGTTPDRSMTGSPRWHIGVARADPTVRSWIVSSARIQNVTAVLTTPHDHFAARPYCRMICPGSGSVGGRGCCPAISTRVIFSAGSYIIGAGATSAPNDHFVASPHCLMVFSPSGRVDGAGSGPTVGTRIVSAASSPKTAVI